ncbi:MAG: serine/threonine protein kinase [Alphaproteobacteria bacterium]|nr:serine/threonine protein kinase [Alphaproteobacteria bacterium]MCB9792649.1 serine/threonine protein kinase [Alphaproteobacteria bacterium]
MATVYRAWDVRLGVPRAIKVLSPQLTRSRSIRRRFLHEARTMAQLEHRYIVAVQDVGVDTRRVYMVMELVEGGNLMDILKERGPLTVGQALEVTRCLLEGLVAAHGKEIIHRDIKPANIMLTRDGIPKLADFGIARARKSDELSLTRTGSILGTFGYMAPEQRNDSKQVDARADLYSVAATLYALISGVEPVDLYAVEVHAKSFANFPGGVAEFIKKGTCYNVRDRWQSAAEMLEALGAIQSIYQAEEISPLLSDERFDDEVNGIDYDEVVSDIMPELLDVPEGQEARPSSSSSGPGDSNQTGILPPPHRMQRLVDFLSGVLLVVFLAGLGFFAWRAFGGS